MLAHERLAGWDRAVEILDRYAARLAQAAGCPPLLLLADTLAGIREMLPPGMKQSERMPADPPEVVEIWFAG